jgi:predicted RecA/RadA family phage recombinase
MALGSQARTNKDGEKMTYTPSATVNAGTVVQLDDLRAGVVINRLTVDDDGTQAGGCDVEGVFWVRKDSTAFVAGDQVFWDTDGTGVDGTTGGAATTTTQAPASGFPLGRAVDADGTAVDTGRVILNVLGRSDTIADADGTLADLVTKFNSLLTTLENNQILNNA